MTTTTIFYQYGSMLTKVIFIFADTSFKQKSTSGASNNRTRRFRSKSVVSFGYVAPTNMANLHFLSFGLESKNDTAYVLERRHLLESLFSFELALILRHKQGATAVDTFRELPKAVDKK